MKPSQITTASLFNVMPAKLVFDPIGERASRALVISEDKLDSRLRGNDNKANIIR